MNDTNNGITSPPVSLPAILHVGHGTRFFSLPYVSVSFFLTVLSETGHVENMYLRVDNML